MSKILSRIKELFLGLQALSVLFFVLPVHAWNAMGHRVIAEIAYAHLTPQARHKVDELTATLSLREHHVITFADMNVWPDTLRGPEYQTFAEWHYVDFPLSLDSTPIKTTLNKNNALHALENILPVLQNSNRERYEQARMLAFFCHIIGDLHQPLHTVSLISTDFPNGDRGGNYYRLGFTKHQRVFNGVRNLHQLWDRGLGVLPKGNRQAVAYRIAKELMREYPWALMEKQTADRVFPHWTKEGMQIAKEIVYSTPLHQTPSSYYLYKGQDVAKQRLVLAGYRLAAWLNQVYVMSGVNTYS